MIKYNPNGTSGHILESFDSKSYANVTDIITFNNMAIMT